MQKQILMTLQKAREGLIKKEGFDKNGKKYVRWVKPNEEEKRVMAEAPKARKPNQGMNWCALPKRMALYHRDGFECAYCGRKAEDEHGKGLTLDHITPNQHGGSNDPSNLVTCCNHHNSMRSDVPYPQFLVKLRGELGEEATAKAQKKVLRLTKKQLDREEGRKRAAIREEVYHTARCKEILAKIAKELAQGMEAA